MINIAFQATILVFTCLALAVSLKRVRVHRIWLFPAVIGQSLSLCGGLLNLALVPYVQANGLPISAIGTLLIPQQLCFGLGTICLAGSAVALFLTLQALAAESLRSGKPPTPPAA